MTARTELFPSVFPVPSFGQNSFGCFCPVSFPVSTKKKKECYVRRQTPTSSLISTALLQLQSHCQRCFYMSTLPKPLSSANNLTTGISTTWKKSDNQLSSSPSVSDSSGYFSSSSFNSHQDFFDYEGESAGYVSPAAVSRVTHSSDFPSYNGNLDLRNCSSENNFNHSSCHYHAPVGGDTSNFTQNVSSNNDKGFEATNVFNSNLTDDAGSSPSHLPGNNDNVKSKSNYDTRKRVKDEEGFIRRAACVCVNDEESEVILITSKTDPEGWLIPGGGLEDHEEEEVAAVRETWEESGVTGQVRRCLGTFKSEDDISNKKKRTTVYVLKVTDIYDDFPEATSHDRQRQWFSIEEAKMKLQRCKRNQIAYLEAL